jgi:hypothetical protein
MYMGESYSFDVGGFSLAPSSVRSTRMAFSHLRPELMRVPEYLGAESE